MANAVQCSSLESGPSNKIVRLVGRLDTSDEAYVIKVDPTTFTDTGTAPNLTTLGCSSITNDNSTHPTRLRIRAIDFDIEDGLTVALWWDVDGTSGNAQRILDLEGRHYFDYRGIGDITSKDVPVVTGKIGLSTQGWAASAILSYSIILELIKY